MSLLVCSEECSLAEFSQKHQLSPHTLWLPLKAALPARAGAKSTVSVDPRTPIALLETATDTLLLDKRAICVKLQVANAVRCEETTVVVDPAAVPTGCEVFVRWSRPGGKKLRANTLVLHYDVEKATSASARGFVAGLKRSRVDDNDSSVGASSLAGSLQGKQSRLSLVQQSTEDLQRRLRAAVDALGSQLSPRSTQILQSTLVSMRHRHTQPPLHFVLPSDATGLEAAGVTWTRSNRRILSRVFRSTTSEERSEASKYSDGSRQLRFYFIEDVLLRRTREWTAAAAASRCHSDEDGKAGKGTPPEEVELLLKDEVLADMNTFAERGFRIVFLEHYPVLHHGSRYTVEQTLAPVVHLCRKGCPHLTVTVVLTAMSCVTAARKQGLELSLVLPQAGLLTFFISELNASLSPDPKTAAVVGSSDRGSEFLNKLHAEFACNASLTYVDERELRRQR
ncbi:conserved hypothetical protein [Leishmania mexicana MHOM/GT/2001/U1103]|uniref:Uncharacterized protein n=1 Tax=Leishmania mexicana (strain MHOM/GT/2001/U1103) TaxID=929439 RepID=E9ARE7_LEIMU|nr:conserved hypothetical protein [Leishmania mexicana MHOM/GT/2001/U1103]CBZ25518.1 conserved hypothetical protein [Leishmania mexicana MHOM/GT/2001/U1103]